jgi:hypothetical protein
MKPYYYYRTIERVNIALIDMFNNISINRFDELNNISKIIKCNVIFHGDKSFTEYYMNITRRKEGKHVTPVLGLRINGIARNPEAKTTTNDIRQIYNENTREFVRDRVPSPWIVNYTLSIYAEDPSDFFQMLEGIITYFEPWLSLSIREFEFLDVERDIPVTLSSVTTQFNDELEREKHNSFTADLTLEAKVVLYPPITTTALVKHIKQNIIVDNNKIGEISSDGIYPETVETYNRAVNEIVEAGSMVDSIVVSTVNSEQQMTLKMHVNINSPSKISLGFPKEGSTIFRVDVKVTEKFNDFLSVVSIGDSTNSSKYMEFSDSNLSIVNLYSIGISSYIEKPTEIFINYDRADATFGSFEVTAYLR